MSGTKWRTEPRPLRFAVRSAKAACLCQFIAGGAVVRRLGGSDTGTDLPRLIHVDRRGERGESFSPSSFASCASSLTTTVANASSSKRPNAAPGGSADLSRSAMLHSMVSPPARPSVSLTSWKLSMSSVRRQQNARRASRSLRRGFRASRAGSAARVKPLPAW